MSSFAVNRKSMNRGCGERSGRWVFEEFMYTESTFGSAVVEYDAFFHPPYACDDFLYAPGMNKGMIELHYVSVKDIVVFDDDGNSVPLDSNAIDACTKIVMDAFEAIVSDVKEFELEIRHA